MPQNVKYSVCAILHVAGSVAWAARTSLELETGVSIEEVTDSGDSEASGGCSPDITEAISAPSSPVKEPLAPLFNSNQTKSLPRGTTSDFILNSGKNI